MIFTLMLLKCNIYARECCRTAVFDTFICTHSEELSSFKMKGFSSAKLLLPVAWVL